MEFIAKAETVIKLPIVVKSIDWSLDDKNGKASGAATAPKVMAQYSY